MQASGSENDGAGCPSCNMVLLDTRIDSSGFSWRARAGPASGRKSADGIRFPGPDDGGAIPADALAEAPASGARRLSRIRRPAGCARRPRARASPDAESRVVRRGRDGTGPSRTGRSRARTWRGDRARDWTVLVQDTNHFSDRAEALLARFAFVPHARVDDLMVSYAVPGGTVGPHVDSYDVFLVQGMGPAAMAGLAAARPRVRPRARPEGPRALRAGGGVAARTRRHALPAAGRCALRGRRDRMPHLVRRLSRALGRGARHGVPRLPRRTPRARRRATPTRACGLARAAGRIPDDLVAHVARTLDRIRWRPRDALDFAGRFLSEPKAHVYFTPPSRPLSRARFEAAAARRGVRLDGRARLLYARGCLLPQRRDGRRARGLRGVVAQARRLAHA